MKEPVIEKMMKRMVIDDKYIEQEFKRIASEIATQNEDADFSVVLEGFCGKDVSKIDMSNLSPENFRRLTFDSETIFSNEQIKKFHPEDLVKQVKCLSSEGKVKQVEWERNGKSFSNMESLHSQEINGEGTTIGIIDSCFDSSIAELEGRVVNHVVFEKVDGKISFRKYEKRDGDGFHGNTTACLAAGNECGVAPKAKMYLFGIAEGTDWAEAKEAILQYIKDNNIKLDIISMSAATETSKKLEKYYVS